MATSGRSGSTPVHAVLVSAYSNGVQCGCTAVHFAGSRPACSKSSGQSGAPTVLEDSSSWGGTTSRYSSRPRPSSQTIDAPETSRGGSQGPTPGMPALGKNKTCSNARGDCRYQKGI